MSSLLVSKEKILEFLHAEFSKIEAEYSQQKASKKLKPKIINKKIKKLQNDIKSTLKTNVFENSVTAEIIELKHQVESFYKKLL